MDIKRSELDFFKCQVLRNKQCTFVVRGENIYFYVGENKYIIDDCTADDFINFPEDVTYKGFIYFFTMDGYYILSFIDETKNIDPIIIKAGNLTAEIA